MTLLRLRGGTRVAIAAACFGGALATTGACGSMAENAAGSSGDGGTEEAGDGSSVGDSGMSDGGITPSVILAVHGSPDLFDFRICLAESPSPSASDARFDSDVAPWPYDGAHPMPMSNYAGVPVGGGAALPREIVPNGGAYIVPYVIDAHQLAMSGAPTAACAQRVGPACTPGSGSCLKTSDYVQLAPISVRDIAGPGAKILAVVGCVNNGASACDATQNGTLRARVIALAPSQRLSIDQLGVQLAHAAPAIGPMTATLDAVVGGTGTFLVTQFESAPPNGAIVGRPMGQSSLAWGSQGVTIVAGDAGVRMSLADIQRVVDPSVLPSTLFQDGVGYAFVVVGDPAAQNPLYTDGGLNARYDGKALHVIALPTIASTLGDGG
jgi:hypothetical protein